MAAPTFVADYEGASWDTTTTPKTTGSFNPSSADVLVACVVDENDNGTENYTYSSTPGSQAWTENTESAGFTNADTWVQTATTVMSSGQSGFTVSAARTAGSTERYGLLVARFSGSDGIGNVGQLGNESQYTASFTTAFANSAVVVVIGDWNATDASSRTWATVNGFTPSAGNGQELLYFRNSVAYVAHVAYYPDVGAAGAKTVGISSPAGTGSITFGFVEVRGSSGTSYTETPTDSAGLTDDTDIVGGTPPPPTVETWVRPLMVPLSRR